MDTLVLLQFYSTACAMCDALAETYRKAAHLLSASWPPSRVLLAKADTYDNRPLALSMGMLEHHSLPTGPPLSS